MVMARSRLSVLIVGAGIAGLAVAIALRPFANVTILESASDLKEVGAAVTLGPGAVRILRSWGVHLEEWDGAHLQQLKVYNSEGHLVITAPLRSRELAGEDVVIIHRADLHAALLETATTEFATGTPCRVILRKKVIAMDAEAGSVVVEDGTTYSAHVVIGADGVRSRVRPYITTSSGPKPVGETAYRVLVSTSDLKEVGAQFVNKHGVIPPHVLIAKGPERKIVAYPCRGGHFLNLVCFVPDEQMDEETSHRIQKGNAGALAQAYSSFAPMWTDILTCGEDLGQWQMCDMDPLPTWVRGRAIIVGDAAHPMLPHQAGGALSAIEDAEALGAFLRDAAPHEVHDALQRVFRVRFKRTAQYQLRSRADGINKQAPPAPLEEQIQLWDYPGAVRWESERADMVLLDGEEAVFSLP